MLDKIVLVTGSTDGIGKQTALELAHLGAHVLIHGRSTQRCQSVVDEIHQALPNAKLDHFVADFSSLRQIRNLASELLSRYDHLDVLINNAGVVTKKRQLTEDGLETTFVVNHLAPFLLTNLLFVPLKRSASSRIINVSSMTHQWIDQVDFNNLQGEVHFDGRNAYALSKLGNILFTYSLSERLIGYQVTANCLHPGVIDTKLLRVNYSGGASLSIGAETSVYLSSSPLVEGMSGGYYVRKQPQASSPLSRDEDLRKAFWEISARLVEL